MTTTRSTETNPWRRSAHRAAWGLLDQCISSITNFALALIVARSVGALGFGAFGIVFTTYTLVLGLVRTVTTEPLALRYGDKPETELRNAIKGVTGLAIAAGLCAGVGCAALGVLFDGSIKQGFWTLAIVLPGLLLQDAWRLSFFVAGREARAVSNDLVWAGAFAVAVIALMSADANPSMPALLAAWGGAGSIAAVAGCFQASLAPRISAVAKWWKENIALGRIYAGEFVAAAGGTHISFYAVGLVAGIAAAGALRGGQVVMGPLNIAFMGLALVAVPEATRWRARSVGELRKGCRRIAVLLAAAAALWGTVVLLLPSSIGREILGATWPDARRTLLPLTLWLCASGVVAAGALGLRITGRARRSFHLRLLIMVCGTLGVALGAAIGDAPGAAWALAISGAVGAAAWWWEFARGLDGGDDESDPVPSTQEFGLNPSVGTLLDQVTDE